MIPAFLITLREGLEAALIVGIVAAYLVRVGRSDALPKVWLGVLAAVILSVVAGVVVVATIGRLPFVVQETVEGIAALLAVAVLTWMLFWMRRQGRAMKGDLEAGVDLALASGSVLALAGLAFVSVAREGLETVLFMAAVSRPRVSVLAQRSGRSPVSGWRSRSAWRSSSPASGSTCVVSSRSPGSCSSSSRRACARSRSTSSARRG